MLDRRWVAARVRLFYLKRLVVASSARSATELPKCGSTGCSGWNVFD